MADKNDPERGKKAVTTAEAKGASTEIVKNELKDVCDKLLAIPEDKREKRSELLIELKKEMHEDTKNFLYLTRLRERQHYFFMNDILPFVSEINTKDRPPHDCSKDDLFFFAAPAYFDGGVKTDDMKKFVDSELKRHYVHEPHHPEYELYHDEECSFEDIVEMAVDRLARNVQFGNGIVNLEVMAKFKPTFSRGDNEAKRETFWKYVLKYQDFVQEEFLKMFPEAKEWSKQG